MRVTTSTRVAGTIITLVSKLSENKGSYECTLITTNLFACQLIEVFKELSVHGLTNSCRVVFLI